LVAGFAEAADPLIGEGGLLTLTDGRGQHVGQLENGQILKNFHGAGLNMKE